MPDLLKAPFPVCGVMRTAARETPTKQNNVHPKHLLEHQEVLLYICHQLPGKSHVRGEGQNDRKLVSHSYGTNSVDVTFTGGSRLGACKPTPQAPQGNRSCSHLHLSFFRTTLQALFFLWSGLVINYSLVNNSTL